MWLAMKKSNKMNGEIYHHRIHSNQLPNKWAISTYKNMYFPSTWYWCTLQCWLVTDIQYCYVSVLHISSSLITVAGMHSTPCSSNQCNTAQLESKLTLIHIMLISSHEIGHWFSNNAQRPSYQNPYRRTKLYAWETRSVPQCSLERPPLAPHLFLTPRLTICQNNHFCAIYIFCHYCTYLHNNDEFWPWQIFAAICQIVNLTIPYDISVVSTTVLTIMTAHNTAISIPVLIAFHFLCMAIVQTHVCLTFVHKTIHRQIDSVHYVVCMSYDRHTSPSLILICNNRQTDKNHIVPYVDTLGSTGVRSVMLNTHQLGALPVTATTSLSTRTLSRPTQLPVLLTHTLTTSPRAVNVTLRNDYSGVDRKSRFSRWHRLMSHSLTVLSAKKK